MGAANTSTPEGKENQSSVAPLKSLDDTTDTEANPTPDNNDEGDCFIDYADESSLEPMPANDTPAAETKVAEEVRTEVAEVATTAIDIPALNPYPEIFTWEEKENAKFADLPNHERLAISKYPYLMDLLRNFAFCTYTYNPIENIDSVSISFGNEEFPPMDTSSSLGMMMANAIIQKIYETIGVGSETVTKRTEDENEKLHLTCNVHTNSQQPNIAKITDPANNKIGFDALLLTVDQFRQNNNQGTTITGISLTYGEGAILEFPMDRPDEPLMLECMLRLFFDKTAIQTLYNEIKDKKPKYEQWQKKRKGTYPQIAIIYHPAELDIDENSFERLSSLLEPQLVQNERWSQVQAITLETNGDDRKSAFDLTNNNELNTAETFLEKNPEAILSDYTINGETIYAGDLLTEDELGETPAAWEGAEKIARGEQVEPLALLAAVSADHSVTANPLNANPESTTGGSKKTIVIRHNPENDADGRRFQWQPADIGKVIRIKKAPTPTLQNQAGIIGDDMSTSSPARFGTEKPLQPKNEVLASLNEAHDTSRAMNEEGKQLGRQAFTALSGTPDSVSGYSTNNDSPLRIAHAPAPWENGKELIYGKVKPPQSILYRTIAPPWEPDTIAVTIQHSSKRQPPKPIILQGAAINPVAYQTLPESSIKKKNTIVDIASSDFLPPPSAFSPPDKQKQANLPSSSGQNGSSVYIVPIAKPAKDSTSNTALQVPTNGGSLPPALKSSTRSQVTSQRAEQNEANQLSSKLAKLLGSQSTPLNPKQSGSKPSASQKKEAPTGTAPSVASTTTPKNAPPTASLPTIKPTDTPAEKQLTFRTDDANSTSTISPVPRSQDTHLAERRRGLPKWGYAIAATVLFGLGALGIHLRSSDIQVASNDAPTPTPIIAKADPVPVVSRDSSSPQSDTRDSASSATAEKTDSSVITAPASTEGAQTVTINTTRRKKADQVYAKMLKAAEESNMKLKPFLEQFLSPKANQALGARGISLSDFNSKMTTAGLAIPTGSSPLDNVTFGNNKEASALAMTWSMNSVYNVSSSYPNDGKVHKSMDDFTRATSIQLAELNGIFDDKQEATASLEIDAVSPLDTSPPACTDSGRTTFWQEGGQGGFDPQTVVNADNSSPDLSTDNGLHANSDTKADHKVNSAQSAIYLPLNNEKGSPEQINVVANAIKNRPTNGAVEFALQDGTVVCYAPTGVYSVFNKDGTPNNSSPYLARLNSKKPENAARSLRSNRDNPLAGVSFEGSAPIGYATIAQRQFIDGIIAQEEPVIHTYTDTDDDAEPTSSEEPANSLLAQTTNDPFFQELDNKIDSLLASLESPLDKGGQGDFPNNGSLIGSSDAYVVATAKNEGVSDVNFGEIFDA